MCCQKVGLLGWLVLTFQDARTAGFFSRRRCMRWMKCSEAPAAREAAIHLTKILAYLSIAHMKASRNVQGLPLVLPAAPCQQAGVLATPSKQ